MYRFTFWRCLHLLTQRGHRRGKWVTRLCVLGPGLSGTRGQRPSRGLSPEGSRVPPGRCIICQTSPLFWHQWVSGGFYTRARTNTHIHRHTLKSSTAGPPRFHSLYLKLLFSLSWNLLFRETTFSRPSGHPSPYPPVLWSCAFPRDVGGAPRAPSPTLRALSPREPGLDWGWWLSSPPQHTFPTLPRKLSHRVSVS